VARLPIRFRAESRISIIGPARVPALPAAFTVVANMVPPAEIATSVTDSFAENVVKSLEAVAVHSASELLEVESKARKTESPAVSACSNGVPVMVETSGCGACWIVGALAKSS
jgi:hypothetical protein